MNPSEPEGKPPAVRRVETFLQGGARYDGSAVPVCAASDAELMARGEEACPPESRIGEGFTTVDTGVEGPERFLDVDIDFFNNAGELIYLNTDRGTGARVVVRADAYKLPPSCRGGFLHGTSFAVSCVVSFTTLRAARRRAHITRRVNVDVSDVEVKVPVAVAANICDFAVNVLSRQREQGRTECDVVASSEA